MVENQKKNPVYLLTGLIIGVLLGILYGWVINPLRYVDISPKALHSDQQKAYFLLIAQAYDANQDIGRAYARVKQLTDPVDVDYLRAMLLQMEDNEKYAASFHVLRNFVNDLENYLRMMNPNAVSNPVPRIDFPSPQAIPPESNSEKESESPEFVVVQE